MAFVKKHVML